MAPVAMGGIGAAMAKEKAIRKILGRNKGTPKSGEKYKKYLKSLKEVTDKSNLRNISKKFSPATVALRKVAERRLSLSGLGSRAAEAAKATRYGKIALGVAAAGLTAKEYLKRKMKKNEKKPQKKMGGGAVKKYSQGMSYQDMIPYGGKFVKIKKEMRDKATKNVKQLTTSDAAYSPERRYAALTQKTPSGGKRYVKPITDWDNKQDVIAGMKDRLAGTQYGQGNWRAQVLTPSEAEEQRLIPRQKRISGRRPAQVAGKNYPQRLKKKQPPRSRRELVRPKNVLGRMGGGMMQRPNPVGYSKGTMVKAKGCKLGRNKPTKLY